MTDRIALVLGFCLAAFLIADLAVFRWGATLFLMREFILLVDWVAFWR